ncbi:hypothetical protein [Streptomyces fradiae]|uniref:hypothetical protein n=1 Tax=Streptomyces fradiae TaxID=1906 RepID=UPI00294332C3|nr:hypothetical protein [Streptomyces fradiae]WOI58625.1 hypothetical protein RYQ63_00995 [Streptomyces fradiae]
MITLVRTRTLRALRADLADAETRAAAARTDANQHQQAAELANDSAIRAESTIEELQDRLRRTIANEARAVGELAALRAQTLLDTEDRAALRMLLRTVRKQAAALDRVYVLFHRGALHSVHASMAAAEAAAEAEGAPRSGWTAHAPGAALPAAAEVTWCVRPVPLGHAPTA